MNNLSLCLEKGRGADVNMVEAANWYAKAAHAGDFHAMYNYARCLEAGTDITRDLAQAVIWYCRAADGGSPGAKNWLAGHAGN